MKSKGTGTSAREKVFEGLPVGAGIAIGTVFRHDSHALVQVRERRIPATKIRSEQHRVLEAAAEATGRIETLQGEAKRMAGPAGEELGYILEAYTQMLSGSRLVRGVQKRIAQERINAEAAVMKEIGDPKKVVLCIYFRQPYVLDEESGVKNAGGLVATFGVSDEALMDVLTGRAKPQGKLPFALARTLAAIEANDPDAPGYPAKDTLFPFGFGLDY